MPTRRVLNLSGFALCAALIAYALFEQNVLGVEPCPLCIFQRVGVMAMGLLFLVAGLHAPRGRGALAYGILIDLAALATIGIAAKHLWIQHLPEGAVPSCGANLATLMDMFPIVDVVKKVFNGSGECHQVNWSLLGLSMPGWVLLAAAALGLLGLLANLRSGRAD
jgi:disulfide bond formation protein DsbB